MVVQSNLAIRNFLVTLKLFFNVKWSLFIWSKWQIDYRKWFLNTNKFLIAKFDCISKFQRIKLELVSKDLNHFGAIVSFFQDWAPETLTGGA